MARPQAVTDKIAEAKAALAATKPGDKLTPENHKKLSDFIALAEGDNIVWGSLIHS
jgi:hypothetical protein